METLECDTSSKIKRESSATPPTTTHRPRAGCVGSVHHHLNILLDFLSGSSRLVEKLVTGECERIGEVDRE